MALLGLWIALVCMLYILVIIQIYGIYKFKSLESLLIIQKRYPKIILAEAYALLLWLMFAAPLWSNYQHQSTDFGIQSAEYFFFDSARVVHLPFAYFIGLAELSRLYLISFHLHYLHASKNEQWKSQIDETFSDKDWYLANKNIFGNRKNVLIAAFVYSLFVIPLVTISFLMNASTGGIVNIIFLSIPIAIVLGLYYKSRTMFNKLGDKFFFYFEFKTTAIIWTICLFLNILLTIIYESGLNGTATKVFIFLNGVIAYTVPSLLSTVVITRKVLSLHVWTTLRHNFDEEIVTPSNASPGGGGGGANETDKVVAMTTTDKILAMFKDQDKCEEFVHFMYKEFSSESILCFIEFVQFKKRVMEYMEVDSHSEVVFDENFTRSSIVYAKEEINDVQDLRKMAHLLYKKYIAYNCELEVKISKEMRRQFETYDLYGWSVISREKEQLDEFENKIDWLIRVMFLFIKEAFNRYDNR